MNKETSQDVIDNLIAYVKDENSTKSIQNDENLIFIEKKMKRLIDAGDREKMLKQGDEKLIQSLKEIFDNLAQLYNYKILLKSLGL